MKAQTRARMRTAAVGLGVTLIVALLDVVGGLSGLEAMVYDLRARWCQFFAPPATDQLVHIDIDNAAIEAMGRWPWPRAVLAETIDELRLAKPRAVAFDVIFSEPTGITASVDGQQPIDHDKSLEHSLAALDRAIIAGAFEAVGSRDDKTIHTIAAAAREDLTLSSDALADRLTGKVSAQDVRRFYHEGRRLAMLDRINQVPDALELSDAQLAAAALPELDVRYSDSPQLRLLRTTMSEYRAQQATARKRWGSNETGTFPATRVEAATLPLERFADAADAVGSVYFKPDSDGVVRKIPLWVSEDDDIQAQLGVALALLTLNIPQPLVTLEGGRLTMGGTTMSEKTAAIIGRGGEQPIAMTRGIWGDDIDIPHISVGTLWQLRQTRRRIRANNATAEDALRFLLSRIDQAKLDEHLAAPPAGEDPAALNDIIAWTLAETGAYVEMYADVPPADLTDEDRMFIQSVEDLKTITQANAQLATDLQRTGEFVRQRVEGKAVLFGYTATGLTDVVPTSLHARCPGVVVHGAIFSSIMTGELWRAWPGWLGSLLALVLGAGTTWSAVRFSPMRSAAVAVALGGGYALINGLLLFDYGNIIVPLAGSLAAVALVWAGCTLQQFVAEKRERARITQRFSSYVDPALVSYVLENPDQMMLKGEVRELSVVFTDLAGFTTISERLREATVPLLNEYMGIMVPLIREQGGYVNKFLGDGIMFFYGAPRSNESHALHALTTVLRMQQAMIAFNASLKQRDLPTVAMRAGIASGDMVVGDAGPADAADYTVLGDVVNLSARLESANKATGTWIMINERTAELVGDAMLLRPIGKLQVVGKTEGVKVFEPLAFMSEATDAQRQVVSLSAAMVDAYVAGEFAQCAQAADAMDIAIGKSKLAAIYRDLAGKYMQSPPEDFDGTVVLTSK